MAASWWDVFAPQEILTLIYHKAYVSSHGMDAVSPSFFHSASRLLSLLLLFLSVIIMSFIELFCPKVTVKDLRVHHFVC